MATLLRPLAAALALCAAADLACAAEAPATRPAEFTEHDVIAEVVRFGETYVVDAYKANGRHDPRWDADVTTFLAAEVRGGVSDGAVAYYTLPNVMPWAQRLALGRRAYDAGCRDAIFLYHFGALLEDDRELQGRVYAEAAAAEAESKYLPLLRLLILRAHAFKFTAGSDELARLQPRLDRLLREAMTDRTVLPKWRRAVWNTGSIVFATDNEARLIADADVVADLPDADPWLLNMVLGRAEIRRAWRERGSGLASTVTPDGWKGFHAHIALATEHFRRAIEADGTHPQPFAQMIIVSMAESAGQERAWFDQAIARQADFLPAFQSYRNALLPRWGGTHVELLNLGIEALDGRRFDTRTPGTLLDVVEDIERDMTEPLSQRQKERVYPHVVRCLDGYIAQSPSRQVQNWARTLRAAWAVRLERWDEAKAQLDALGAANARLEAGPFNGIGLDAEESVMLTALHTGPHGPAVRAALKTADDAARADAFKAIAAAIANGGAPLRKVDVAALAWVERNRADAAFQGKLAGGAWVPLPLDLATWQTESGNWSVEPDGTLVGRAADGLSIDPPFTMPERYEFRCLITHREKGDAPPIVYLMPSRAPVLNNTVGIQLNLRDGSGMLIRQYRYGIFRFPVGNDAGKQTVAVHVRVDRGEVSVLDADGDAVVSYDFGGKLTSRRLGLAGLHGVNGSVWSFSKIEVRSLD